ncbi:MAG: glycoside hydrolase family protein, partial [Armatimonadota bacterium]
GKADICWTEPGCYLSPNMKPDEKVGNVWATTKLLKSLSLCYERTGNPEDKTLARRVFEGLRSLASCSGKYAWYPAGFGPVDADLNPISLTWEHTAPCPAVESLVCYWKACGDKEALDLAITCAESIIDGYPDLPLTSINPDGSFAGHTHTTLHAMWGIAHLGVETQNPRYMEFIRRIYQFMEVHGTGTGWMHEGTAPDPIGSDNCSETCTTSDVMSIVACLAQSAEFMGDEYAAYWDHLDRYFRNHISPCQFFVTPEFEAFYRERHKAMPIEMVDAGIESLRKMEGGILAGIGVNDYFNDYPGDLRTSFIMVGCCAPEGMRAIYTTWSNIIRCTTVNERNHVYVNMPLPVENDACEVISYLPDKGQITVKARKSADYRLRPPAWIPKSKVRVWLNGSEINPVCDGAYIAFDSVEVGDIVSITWPLVVYRQHVAIFADPDMSADFTWKGNQAVDVNPPGKDFPMHTGKRIEIPSGPVLPD